MEGCYAAEGVGIFVDVALFIILCSSLVHGTDYWLLAVLAMAFFCFGVFMFLVLRVGVVLVLALGWFMIPFLFLRWFYDLTAFCLDSCFLL